MEVLVYIANCLYLVSYLVKDMIRLRLLTLAGAVCLMTYFFLLPEPLIAVVCWNLVFIGMNIVQLARLLGRRDHIDHIQEDDGFEPAWKAERVVYDRYDQNDQPSLTKELATFAPVYKFRARARRP